MAQPLDELPKVASGPGRHKASKYPWDLWLDGRIWQMEGGVDFFVKAASFRALIYETARKRNIAVQTQIHRGEGATWGKPERFVVCQAFPGRAYSEGPAPQGATEENPNE